MKKIISLLLLLGCILPAGAQKAPYKVIFDLTSSNPDNQQAVIRQAKAIAESRPDAKLEVAMYSEGIMLVCKEKSPLREEVESLMKDHNVAFRVCGYTLKRKNISESDLIPGVKVVPDAIYEIITRQKEGWGYIKVAQ